MDFDLPTPEEQDQKKQLNLVQGFAVDRNPDEAAELYDLSRENGVSFEEAERTKASGGLKGVLRRQPSWETLVRDAPVLAERLGDPGRAASVHDDVENLTLIEKLFRGTMKIPQEIKAGWKRGNAVRKLVGPSWDDLLRQATPDQLAEIEQYRKEIEENPEEKLGYLSGVLPAVAEMAPLSGQTLARSAPYAAGGAGIGAGVGAAGGAIVGGAGAIPGAIGGAGTGAVVGWRAGTFVEGGRAEAALAWDEYKRIPGMDLDAARGAAFAVGLVNGALEAVGLEAIFKVAPGIKKLVGQGGRGVLRRVLMDGTKRQVFLKLAKHIGSGAITEGLTEALQELSNVLGGEIAGGDTFMEALGAAWQQSDRILEAGTKGAQGGGGMSIVVGSAPLPAQLSAARRAKERQAMFAELGRLATESKTLERLPSEFREYVRAMQEKYGAIEDVRVPAEKLNELFQREGWDDQEVAERMPAVARQMADAAQNPGVEVSVPIADLATHIAPTAGFPQLSVDLRVGEEPTAREAPIIEERAKKLIDEMKQKEDKPPARPVFDDVRKQLTEAGISDTAAVRYAAWWDSFVNARAARTGKDPAEYYKNIGLTISNEDFVADVAGEKDEVLTPEQKTLKEKALTGDEQAAEALLEQLMVDELTGANNENAWRRFKAMNKRGVYLSIDANDLKRINDTLGHDKGDEFLKKIAEAVGKPIREQRGKFFRAGKGDEFAAHFRTRAEADAAVKALTEAMNAMPALFGSHKASISLGLGGTFKQADIAAMEAKKQARAAGRSGFGRPGFVEIPDFSKGDVFSASNETGIEELFQRDDDRLSLKPGPAKWASAAEKAVQDAKQEKGDTKSWLSVVSKGVKKEELESLGLPAWLNTVEALKGRAMSDLTLAELSAIFGSAEEAAVASKSPEKFRGILTREQVLNFIRKNKLAMVEDWLGKYRRPPTSEEQAEYDAKLAKWKKDHVEWEEAMREYEERRESGETVLDDNTRDELESDLRDAGIGVNRRRGRYTYSYMGRRTEETDDLDQILHYAYDEAGYISRSDRDEIENLARQMKDLYENPEDYFEPEHELDWSDYKDLDADEQQEKADEIDARLAEIEKEQEYYGREDGEQPLLIPRTEDEVRAIGKKLDDLEYEKERLEYERQLVMHDIKPEVNVDLIEEYAKQIEELAEGNIRVRVDNDGEAHFDGSYEEEYEIEDRDEILDAIEEEQGRRTRASVEEAMDKLESDEEEPPREPRKPELPESIEEDTTQYTSYTMQDQAIPGTERELLLYAPGEVEKNAIKWSAPHFGMSGKGLLAHARVADHDFISAETKAKDVTVQEGAATDPHLFIEEIQSDRFQKARDYAQAVKDEIKGLKQALADMEDIDKAWEKQKQVWVAESGGEVFATSEDEDQRRKRWVEEREAKIEAYKNDIAIREEQAKKGGFESLAAIQSRLKAEINRGAAIAKFEDPLTGKKTTIRHTNIPPVRNEEGLMVRPGNFDKITDDKLKEIAARQFLEEMVSGDEAVLDAPFKGDAWVELTVKRLLLYAAERGYRKINWTTGDQQVERWSGAVQEVVDTIEWQKAKVDGRPVYSLRFYKNGRPAAGEVVAASAVGEFNYNAQRVRDTIGIELLKKIDADANDSGSIKGDQLKVGGEGFRLYYDRKIPSIMEKLTKQKSRLVEHPGLGYAEGSTQFELAQDPAKTRKEITELLEARIEELRSQMQQLAGAGEEAIEERAAINRKMNRISHGLGVLRGEGDDAALVIEAVQRTVLPNEDPDGKLRSEDVDEFENHTGVEIRGTYLTRTLSKEKVWEIDFPEELRNKLLTEGVNLFQKGRKGLDDYRGKIGFDDARTWFKITLTGRANLSTFIHESGHAFLELMIRDAVAGHPQSRADLDIIYKWLGAESVQLTEAQKEKWARGIEAYVRRGKAPSSKLAEVFRAFKGWLMMIYSSLRGLDVQLNDEITGVMDRLFATDMEIEQAKRELSILPTLEADGMTAEEHLAYKDRVERATREAQEEFDREAIREWRRGVGAEHERVKRDVEEMVRRNRAYNAWEALRTGKRLDGAEVPMPGKLSRERLKEYALGPAAARRLAAVSEAEGGVDPETVAPFYGFASGIELAKALAELQPRAAFVREEARARMAEKYPGFDGSKEWFAEGAVRHLHSNEVNGVLWSEYVAVSRMIGARPDPSGKLVLNRAAERRVEEMTRVEMQPGIYERAEALAAREWVEAYKKKDYRAAADAKRRQLWNHALYKQVTKARDEAEAAQKYLSRFEDMNVRRRIGKAGARYLEAIDAIIEKIELRRVSNKELRRRESLATFIDQMEADGDSVAIPPELRSEAGFKNWKQMTLSELRAVLDAVKNIEHMARTKNRLFDGRESRNFAETTVKLAEHIKANVGEEMKPDKPGSRQNPGWWDEKKAWLRSAHMSLTKIEFLARVMDGGKTAGWAHELIFEPLVKAQAEKMKLTRAVTRELTRPFDEMSISDRLRYDREVDFLGYRLKLREVLAVALNLGNEGNKRRLIEGYAHRAGWTEEAILKRAGELLTDQDLDLVEHIWKVIGSLKEKIGEVHQRTVGVQPEWVEPTTVTINGRTLAGGYYPIVKDRNRSQLAEDIAQRKTGEVWENSFMAPVTESGFTKSRGNDMSPLLLSLDVVPAHLNEVIHYVTHYEAVRAVDRLTRNRKVEAAIKNGFGNEAYQLFRPWLQAVAKDGNIHEGQDFIDKTLRRLRIGSSIALLGFKVATGMKQWFGLTGTAKEIGPKWAAVGSKVFLRKLFDVQPFAEASEHSTEISDIDFTHDRDIGQMFDRMMSGFSEFGHLKKRFAQVALGWIMLNQKAVNAITWYGAREKALAEGHPDPVRYANSIVRMSQSGGGIKDLAAIQRGTETKRLFVTLYTYFSVMFNQLAEPMSGKKRSEKAAIFAARWLWLVTLPVILDMLTSGRGPEDGDDPEDWLLYATREQLLYAGRTIPFVGSVLDATLSERERRYGAWFDTMLKGAAAAGRAARRGGEVTDSEIKAMSDLLGSYYGLPSGAARNAYKYLDEFSRMDEPVMNLLFRSPGDYE